MVNTSLVNNFLMVIGVMIVCFSIISLTIFQDWVCCIPTIIVGLIVAIIGFLMRRKQMNFDTSELYSSGILYDWEEIFDTFYSTLDKIGTGFLLITNERLIFVMKTGFFSKGYKLIKQIALLNISSVSITGLVPSWVEISCHDRVSTLVRGKDNILLRKKIVAHKSRVFENQKTSGKNENPQDILRKRLARGEITLEEFHQLVQRT